MSNLINWQVKINLATSWNYSHCVLTNQCVMDATTWIAKKWEKVYFLSDISLINLDIYISLDISVWSIYIIILKCIFWFYYLKFYITKLVFLLDIEIYIIASYSDYVWIKIKLKLKL